MPPRSSFLRRHRGKILAAAAVGAVGYGAYYVYGKYREIMDELDSYCAELQKEIHEAGRSPLEVLFSRYTRINALLSNEKA